MNVSTVDESIEVVAAQDAAPVAATPDLLCRMHAYWQAANTVSLVRDSVRHAPATAHGDPHGSSLTDSAVALNLVYVHLNRLIRDYDLSMMLVAGGRDGAAALDAQRYLESLSVERQPAIACHRDGLPCLPSRQAARQVFHEQFAMPRQRKTSQADRSLVHACGAAFESPELIVACFIEDAQAEAGMLAAGWHGNALLDPKLDGAMLPILHLGGVHACGEDAPARLSDEALVSTLRAQGYEPSLVACDDLARMHQCLAETLDAIMDCIGEIQSSARSAEGVPPTERPRWPMLILHTPRDWNGPVVADTSAGTGERDRLWPLDGSFSHLTPASSLEFWIKSSAPNECFNEHGALRAELARLAPKMSQCLGSNTYLDDGSRSALSLPERHRYAVIAKGSDDLLTEGKRVLDTCLDDLDALQGDSQSSFYFATEESLPMRLFAIAGVLGENPGVAFDDDVTEKMSDGLAIHALSNDILREWQDDCKTAGCYALPACYEAFIQALERRLKEHAARTVAMQSALPSDVRTAVQSAFGSRSLPSRDHSIEPMVAAKEPPDRAHAETSGCHALKRSGLENIACSCNRIHHEAHAFGDPGERRKRSVAEFEDDIGNRHDAAHGRWSY